MRKSALSLISVAANRRFEGLQPRRRRVSALVSSFALLSLLVLLPAQLCHAAEKWQGNATNTAGDFNYGKVTFTVSGTTMKDLIIEGVTTSGCGGYKSVVVPKVKIRGSKFSATYTPIPGIDDVIRVSGTIRNGKATGTFSEGPLCQNAGKFGAKRK